MHEKICPIVKFLSENGIDMIENNEIWNKCKCHYSNQTTNILESTTKDSEQPSTKPTGAASHLAIGPRTESNV